MSLPNVLRRFILSPFTLGAPALMCKCLLCLQVGGRWAYGCASLCVHAVAKCRCAHTVVHHKCKRQRHCSVVWGT